MSAASGLERVAGRVHGHVQGVGYRAFAARWGKELGLRGWVQNEPGGTVGFVAEGPRAALERFLNALHVGPPPARVARIDEAWTPPEDRLSGFEIRR